MQHPPCFGVFQIFSRQAIQMDALIATFVDDYKQRVQMYNPDDPDGNLFNDSSSTEADGEKKGIYSGLEVLTKKFR